jgi:hypothetical protein
MVQYGMVHGTVLWYAMVYYGKLQYAMVCIPFQVAQCKLRKTALLEETVAQNWKPYQ